VYCGSGIRSAKAAAILKEKGYDQVYELDGGIKAWKEAGLPVE
jgi:rhodanese-related sulfurtransferase